MKFSGLPAVILLLLFSSCTIEDEMVDLTYQQDMLIEVMAVLEDPDKPYVVDMTSYRTDGYGRLKKKMSGYNGTANSQSVTIMQAAKAYKKVGVEIGATQNVSAIHISFYLLGHGKDLFFRHDRETPKPFALMYDFDTGNHTLIEE